MRPEHLCLSEILEAIDDIAEFVGGCDLEAFLADKQLRYAVVFALQTLGEAARRLPESIHVHHPQISWHEVMGQRNVIAQRVLPAEVGRYLGDGGPGRSFAT